MKIYDNQPIYTEELISRRRFFGKSAEVIWAVTAGAVGTTVAAATVRRWQEDDRNLLFPTDNTDRMLVGSVEIIKSIDGETVKVRQFPDASLDTPNEIYSWDDITAINGIPIQDVSKFTIENPLITAGFNPDGDKEPGEWIQLTATMGDATKSVFISKSNQTAAHVLANGTSTKFDKVPNGLAITGKNLILPRQKVGKVSIPDKEQD